MRKRSLLILAGACLGLLTSAAHADMKVATLHPLMSDLAQNVGGGHVTVVSLLKPGGDPHNFEPTPGDLARIRDARLILASGKGLEPYLPKLEDNLAQGQTILEVGRKVPSVRVSGTDELFVCCPAHSVGGIDPHWWHSVSAMKRATRIVADAFAEADPANSSSYRANASAYEARLDQLDQWIKSQVSSIPRSQRKLTTSHLAFGYFCRDYGFKALPIQGLTRESNPSPDYLAESIKAIEKEVITAVFPEHLANPKVLQSMVDQTGVALGKELIADGTGTGSASTYEGMMRQNVSRIVEALSRG